MVWSSLVVLVITEEGTCTVEHTMNIEEFEDAPDADSRFVGVCIWRSVPSKGQNHMLSDVECEGVVVP